MSQWVSLLQNAQKSCMVQGNLKKVHYDLADGRELVEEYNTDTGVLTRRAWKVKSDIGGDGQWDIEIGDPEPTRLRDDNYIKEDSTQVNSYIKANIRGGSYLYTLQISCTLQP